MSESDNKICDWNRVYIPDACKGVEIVVGIDEAGRGPVVGPLVYCAAFWPKSLHDEICKMGFNDSKQLKESDREKMFEEIKSHSAIGWVIEELTAEFISENMLKPIPKSLNAISYDGVINMLSTIRDGGVNTNNTVLDPDQAPIVNHVYVDTVGDPETYKQRLTSAFGDDFANFTIEKKADATYKVVGAASIIAKVTRDSVIKQWIYKEMQLNNSLDKSFGSGYPGDENCVNWLQKANKNSGVFGFPSIVRFSWSTVGEYLNIAAKTTSYSSWGSKSSSNGSSSSSSSSGGSSNNKNKFEDENKQNSSSDKCNDSNKKIKTCHTPVVRWECDEEDNGSNITDFFGAKNQPQYDRRSKYYTRFKMKHLESSDFDGLR